MQTQAVLKCNACMEYKIQGSRFWTTADPIGHMAKVSKLNWSRLVKRWHVIVYLVESSYQCNFFLIWTEFADKLELQAFWRTTSKIILSEHKASQTIHTKNTLEHAWLKFRIHKWKRFWQGEGKYHIEHKRLYFKRNTAFINWAGKF